MKRLTILLTAVVLSLHLMAENYLELAKQAGKEGNYEAVVEYATEHLSTSPKDATAYFYRAVAYASFKEYGKALKDVEIDDNAFKGIEAIILSMTPHERQHPEVLNQSRKNRIAKGSGTTIQEVNRLVKQFDQTRKMMRMVTGSKMGKMMARRPKMPGMPKMR